MRELIQTSVREVLPSLLEGALASASRTPGTAGGEPSSRDTDGKHSYHTVLLQLTQNTVRLSKLTSSVIKFWVSVRMGPGGHLTGIIIYPPCQSVLIMNGTKVKKNTFSPSHLWLRSISVVDAWAT